MASNRPSVDTQDMYFTPRENIEKALHERTLDLEKQKQFPIYSNEPASLTYPDISSTHHTEYYEYDDGNDEYVLPPSNPKSSHSPSYVTFRPTIKRDVRDLKDEDNYDLPDITGCVTKGAGVLNIDHGEKQSPTSSKTKESKCWENKWKLTGVLVLILFAGGITGAVLTVFTGTISSFLERVTPYLQKIDCAGIKITFSHFWCNLLFDKPCFYFHKLMFPLKRQMHYIIFPSYKKLIGFTPLFLSCLVSTNS